MTLSSLQATVYLTTQTWKYGGPRKLYRGCGTQATRSQDDLSEKWVQKWWWWWWWCGRIFNTHVSVQMRVDVTQLNPDRCEHTSTFSWTHQPEKTTPVPSGCRFQASSPRRNQPTACALNCMNHPTQNLLLLPPPSSPSPLPLQKKNTHTPPPPPPKAQTRSTCVLNFSCAPAAVDMEFHVDGARGPALSRQQRRLRARWRHEQQIVAMMLATVGHRGRVSRGNPGLRSVRGSAEPGPGWGSVARPRRSGSVAVVEWTFSVSFFSSGVSQEGGGGE